MLKSADVLFISHGGGPLPLLNDPGHRALVETLKELSTTLKRPKAILVVSAHWEEVTLKVTASAQPALIYDYYGFPEESYHITYPCPGSPELAKEVQRSLKERGVEVSLDEARGLDHGVFVPLKLMYPEADIPVVQLSLKSNLSAEEHLMIGEALAHLNQRDLLILGSGFSFHNLPAFFTPSRAEMRRANLACEGWLEEHLCQGEQRFVERSAELIQWERAPFARLCHPREEHLLPLHVCFGVAQRRAHAYRRVEVLNKVCSFFHWRLP